MIWSSLGSTDGKVIGSDEFIKRGSNDGKVLGTILVNIYGIRFGLDVGTYLVSSYGSFDGSNDSMLEGLLIWNSLGSTDGIVLRHDEHIKLVLSYGKMLVTILENIDGITLGLDVGI